MSKDHFEFIVGDCGSVRGLANGNIELTFLSYNALIDGEPIKDADIIEVSDVKPEQAYLLGRALLMAAKMKGISE